MKRWLSDFTYWDVPTVVTHLTGLCLYAFAIGAAATAGVAVAEWLVK